MHATVRDAAGLVVRGLSRSDFEILEDGRPVSISSFSNDPQPLTLALLVEMSWPSSQRYGLLQDSALALSDVLQPTDRLRIGTFADEVALSPWLTSDQTILHRIVREEFWPHSGGRVWAALDAAARSLAAEQGRRAVVVLTRRADDTFVDPCISGTAIRCRGGGLNPYGDLGAAPVRRLLLAEGIGLYAIGLAGVGANLSADLRRTAEESGGADLVLADGIDLTDAFAGVAEDLRHQYLLGFTPSLVDGREHRIEVRVGRAGHAVRARQRYIAATPVSEAPAVTPSRPASRPAPAVDVPGGDWIPARVTHADGRPVDWLTPTHFHVTLDGQARQIREVRRGADVPFTFVVLVDATRSLQVGLFRRTNLNRLRALGAPPGLSEPGLVATDNELRGFLDEAVTALRPGDRLRIGSIGQTAAMTPLLGFDDRGALHRAGRETLAAAEDAAWGPSPIWDAIGDAVLTLGGETGHRALLILTDGAATGNRLSAADVAAWVSQAGVSVHVVGVRDRPYVVNQHGGAIARIDPRSALQQLALASGGTYVSMADAVDPRRHVRQIVRELAESYFLDVGERADGRVVPLTVELTAPGGTVRAPAQWRSAAP